ncbi:hypothetical protein FE257_009564 [Aspergillus nanangensis]|uniref:Uncharacterized protein n=1 Tax=Aspergillus nanangensis TaxID=2582783 RepID=A0AAD4GTT7_ASPNN|nr:hypothetical protein FE257_009564 [Aspergillus nanangensis]
MSRTDGPAIQTGSCLSLQSCPLPLPNPQLQLEDDRFRFTPIKNSGVAHRVWDRKPSTAYMGRPRSRKVWKRFRSSFNSMKALQQMIVEDQKVAVDDLYVEINTSRNTDLLRGVKRQCFTLGEAQSDNTTIDEDTPRGRSFLETKWESEVTGRRRKLPMNYTRLVDDSEPMDLANNLSKDIISDDNTKLDTSTSVESVERTGSPVLTPDTPTELAPELTYHRTLHGQTREKDANAKNIKTPAETAAPGPVLVGSGPLKTIQVEIVIPEDQVDDDDYDDDDDRRYDLIDEESPNTTVAQRHVDDQGVVPPSPAPAAPVQNLTAKQESTLVRSALRSSLDGDDAALLNNFLSKAKAKREAKAAAMIAQDTENEKITPEKELEVAAEMPTPQSRRALEDLDANSPSPQKSQPSPSKPLDKKARAEETPSTEPSATASPRRSTRTRNAKLPSTRGAAVATAVRNTFSLRRAKGTEFVFLQRTDAQELSLTTRRNTRQNKGDALLPKYALQGLTRSSSSSSSSQARSSPSDDDEDRRRRETSSHQKRVSWNDERLAQYEGEDSTSDGGGPPSDDVGDSRRANKSKAKAPSDKRRAASHRSSSRSTSRSTRSQGSPETGEEGVPAASTTAPATATTPRARRVRRVGASTASAPEEGPSTSTPAEKRKKLTPKSPKAGMTESPGSNSKTGAGQDLSLGSSSAKSSRLMKAHAGSTPMPRRVRTRS